MQKRAAKHVPKYQSEKVYFCCDGCGVSFEKKLDAYI